MKTREEVEALKINWHDDPNWDIEETDGFEEYKDELLAYRKQSEKEWEDARQKRHDELALKLCPMKFSATTKDGYYAEIGINCDLEKCAWWNEANDKCVIRVLTMR
jgi:hypothetical protein